jgi:hypothetical protein
VVILQMCSIFEPASASSTLKLRIAWSACAAASAHAGEATLQVEAGLATDEDVPARLHHHAHVVSMEMFL